LDEPDQDRDELAKQYRQLAARCYGLAVHAFDSASSAGFKQWGDQLMTQADALDQGKGKPDEG
jgi:hypothetical protein